MEELTDKEKRMAATVAGVVAGATNGLIIAVTVKEDKYVVRVIGNLDVPAYAIVQAVESVTGTVSPFYES